MNDFASQALDLVNAILALASSPMQRDYVPPEIQAMAKEALRLHDLEVEAREA